MNLLKVFIAVFLLSATAQGKSLYCENGPVEVMGDAWQAYTISKDKIEYTGWEWSYEVKGKDVTFKGSTASVQNVQIDYHVEGEIYKHMLNAIFTLDPDKKTLHIAAGFDNSGFSVKSFPCVIK